ncbi:hypothetical protein Lesp01_63990 [Lentzea sp. NBRC 102530]|nr:hypothetical protein Lesp01_63990 [Lentzea sp. NBRC 102530]
MIAWLSSSVVSGPKFIVPRHRRETDRPLRPRFVYSMVPTLPLGEARRHVELLQLPPFPPDAVHGTGLRLAHDQVR